MTELNNPEDIGIARVLRAAGRRDEPPAEIEASVRATVQAEWRATVAKNSTPRRKVWGAAAAGIGIVVVGWFAYRLALEPHGEDVATHDRALVLNYDGVSVRLDRDTHIVRMDDERITLRSGALYVDSGAASHSERSLQIRTPAGVVSHLGTQYEVRLLSAGTRIRVREGRVLLSGKKPTLIEAREQLTVARNGAHAREHIDADSVEWGWAVGAAPPFDIEGKPLSEFLAWAGRELGQQIVFADAASENEAVRATLHGSIAGLAPQEALAAVLPTTALRSLQQDGRIFIEMQ
jgi:ferric-dicitrate binding protein FerR (iron transport regulator)